MVIQKRDLRRAKVRCAVGRTLAHKLSLWGGRSLWEAEQEVSIVQVLEHHWPDDDSQGGEAWGLTPLREVTGWSGFKGWAELLSI